MHPENDTDFWDVCLNSENGSIAYDEENAFWIPITNRAVMGAISWNIKKL
jgi:hypothetical protein